MVSFLLHLYQPSYQNEAILKKIANESYLPLIKFLKNNRNFKMTLNIPLSLLTLMDSFGYSHWINDIKFLLDRDQIELTGSGAYHPLLTKLTQNFLEKQIILNEYGLGYYFGRRTGFEGERAILISDLKGFFPPEMAINSNVLSSVNNLGYSWVCADEPVLGPSEGPAQSSVSGVYAVKSFNTVMVVRDKKLSNLLAFKRNDNIEDVAQLLKKAYKSTFIMLDGETFGHHNNLGIEFLYNLSIFFNENSIKVLKVSDLVLNSSTKNLDTIYENSWAIDEYSIDNMSEESLYPLWVNKNEKINVVLWNMFQYIQEHSTNSLKDTNEDDYSSIALWDVDQLTKNIKDVKLLKRILKNITLLKLQNSDQFWWSSKATISNNELLYNKDVINSSLGLYEQYISLLDDIEQKNDLTQFFKKALKLIE